MKNSTSFYSQKITCLFSITLLVVLFFTSLNAQNYEKPMGVIVNTSVVIDADFSCEEKTDMNNMILDQNVKSMLNVESISTSDSKLIVGFESIFDDVENRLGILSMNSGEFSLANGKTISFEEARIGYNLNDSKKVNDNLSPEVVIIFAKVESEEQVIHFNLADVNIEINKNPELQDLNEPRFRNVARSCMQMCDHIARVRYVACAGFVPCQLADLAYWADCPRVCGH